MAKSYLTLQDTEGYVVIAAAQIYAAMIQTGQASAGDEDQAMQRAIRDAIRIAKSVDLAIIAEGEMDD
jgi:hypothetical protein